MDQSLKGKGIFITFEGNECAGKSTQIKLLGQYLEGKGKVVKVIREPGGTPLGEEIRELVKKKRTEPVYVEADLCLFQAARAQLVKSVIQPALSAGEIVICDRFYDSTWVYQGWVGGINLMAIDFVNKLVTPGIHIDQTFLLELPVTRILERLSIRAGIDRFEARGEDYFVKVNEGYAQLKKEAARRVTGINADRPQEEIQKDIQICVDKLLASH